MIEIFSLSNLTIQSFNKINFTLFFTQFPDLITKIINDRSHIVYAFYSLDELQT